MIHDGINSKGPQDHNSRYTAKDQGEALTGGSADPTPRSADLWVPPARLPFDVESPPPLRINLHRASMLVQIKGRGEVVTQIDDMALTCPLLHLPYKRTPRPP